VRYVLCRVLWVCAMCSLSVSWVCAMCSVVFYGSVRLATSKYHGSVRYVLCGIARSGATRVCAWHELQGSAGSERHERYVFCGSVRFAATRIVGLCDMSSVVLCGIARFGATRGSVRLATRKNRGSERYVLCSAVWYRAFWSDACIAGLCSAL
jgi:hypothetical protein